MSGAQDAQGPGARHQNARDAELTRRLSRIVAMERAWERSPRRVRVSSSHTKEQCEGIFKETITDLLKENAELQLSLATQQGANNTSPVRGLISSPLRQLGYSSDTNLSEILRGV